MNDSDVRQAKQYSLWIAFLLYLGYLAIFFATWIFNGVDYLRIGENIETTKLWYALPTLFGCAFLLTAISVLGWWRAAIFDKTIAGPLWVWILPLTITGFILNNLANLDASKLSLELLTWSILGAAGVGFGEEMITRGSMIAALRCHFPEPRVWLISTLLFSALHMPNIFFGLPLLAMPIQLLLTFMFGSGLYAIRRISGTLLLPMVLHGLWDSSVFLNNAMQIKPNTAEFIVYPLSIISVIAVLVKTSRADTEPK